MKMITLVLAFVLATTGWLAADTIRFTESLADRLVTTTDPDLGSFTEAVRTVSATFYAVVTVSGLNLDNIPDETSLSISLGGWSFDDIIANGDVFGTRSVTVIQKEFNEETGRETEVGRITFSYVGKVVTISGTSRDLGESAVASEYAEESGRFMGSLEGSISIGEFSANRTVYYKGTNTITRRVVGGGESEDEFFLSKTQLSGQTDDTRPSISIISPAAGARLTNGMVAVLGRATDNNGVNEVSVQVNDDEPVMGELMEGTNLWTAAITLSPGTNVIRAFSVDLDGNKSTPLLVKVFYVFPVEILIEPPGTGTVGPLTNGQFLMPGAVFKIMATPKPGYFFTAWSGDVESTNAMTSFVMAPGRSLRASFIPNPWLPIKGAYNGLFCATTSADATNSGFVTLTLGERGTFTGKILHSGTSRPFSGYFSLSAQTSHVQIARSRASALSMDLQLSTEGGAITGQLADTNWNSPARLARATLFTGTNTTSRAGKYTFTIPGAGEDSTNCPGGDGVGTLVIGAKGAAMIAGTLADGAPFTQVTTLAGAEEFPMFVSLYGGRGVLLGWAAFEPGGLEASPYDLSAPDRLKWFKPARLADKYYPNGFNKSATMFGARYTPPGRGTNALNWIDGVAALGGGNLPDARMIPISVSNNIVRVQGANTNHLTLTFTPANGLYGGTFTHPATGKSAAFKGAVIQTRTNNIGAGWFLGTNQGGFLSLMANP